MFSYKILLLFFFLLILSFLLGYMSTFLNNYDDIKLIEDIALKNASLTEYERSVYDCSEFSENLIETLNKLDYNAISVCGYTNYLDFYKILEYDCKPNSINKKFIVEGIDTYHRWVYIPKYNLYIETTNGYIIPNLFIIGK